MEKIKKVERALRTFLIDLVFVKSIMHVKKFYNYSKKGRGVHWDFVEVCFQNFNW